MFWPGNRQLGAAISCTRVESGMGRLADHWKVRRFQRWMFWSSLFFFIKRIRTHKQNRNVAVHR